ncbi:flagellar protein FlgN [Shewanella sp. A32]|uniref:flagellar protein FlgN n=1 Tax=Shewanella sp. A32 TaxID=3031327 RepID=UPI0023B9EEF5|nr:flagellar protein FlgN [Shewanella sp. A32]MDF0535746.1 flagellar protein FlgN [Shewanella sp. A32]
MSINNLKTFFDSMKQDVAQLNQLIGHLDNQYELLSNRRAEELTSLNNQITWLIQDLRRSNLEREQFLQQLGLPANRAGLKMLLEKLPSPTREKVGELIQELSLKTQTCSMMNERAGKLLTTQRRFMTRFFGLQDQQAYPDFRA